MKRRTGALLIWLGIQCIPHSGAWAQGYPPEEAARRMAAAEGLEVRLVAAEPLVRQPVAIEFDDRGRLWVIQYLQYPNPAGLKRVKVDRYSRTAYDRVPEPPPRGPRGDDRVTILEDADGDGRADRACDFVSGLNLASGLALGDEGLFLLQPPYLLHYADRDHDDRPDGAPEVLLTGFGIEDAHSVANSLTWGPDGWLYGLQGSTVTARVRGVEFQQGVWRYHPRSRRFELFCEGGGNMWGLDFDRRGQLFASTNVGGFVMLHGFQGGYYWKSFGKHGPLHNPYTFGYFDHVPHTRLSGGHVAVGGLFYEADEWPAAWRGRYVAADLLDHSIHWHNVSPRGSTFQAEQGGDVLRARDTWFAPSDLTLGPDGALYVSDWHDRRTAHPDPDADWDRSNGRIYAIAAKGSRSPARRNLAAASSAELLAMLGHPNHWFRRRARRLIAERGAKELAGPLTRTALDGRGDVALEALWALHGCAGLEEPTAERLLEHPDPDVRAWTVRLLGDEPGLSAALRDRLLELAGREPDAIVRAQLASTAQRLPPARGLDIAVCLLLRDLDREDPAIPLLLWWAVERHALADVEDTLRRFSTPAAARSSLVRATILPRLVRRFAAERSPRGDDACARLLRAILAGGGDPPPWSALDEATRGRPADAFSPPLASLVAAQAARNPKDPALTRLSARLGDPSSRDRAAARAAERSGGEADRLAMLDLLGELRDPRLLDRLLALATAADDPSGRVRDAALAALGNYDDEKVASALLEVYPARAAAWKSRARELLLSRGPWARAYLRAIDRGALPAAEITLEDLGRFGTLHDAALEPLIRRHWGVTRGPTPEERLAEIRRLNNDLRAGPGDPVRGRALFQEKCGACHRLNGQGETIGPDLTFANRQDRDYLLTSLVHPGGSVRREYQLYQLETTSGRILSGLISEQSPDALVLRDARGERTRIARADIAEIKESDDSIMPESLYREFQPQQLRDLFSYLQTERPEGSKPPP